MIVSGFGPKAVRLAAEIGDGFATTSPDKDAIDLYRSEGGAWPGARRDQGLLHGRRGGGAATVHRLWPNEALPGELAQVLPTPSHFEQACELVTPDLLSPPMGPDLDAHAATLRSTRTPVSTSCRAADRPRPGRVLLDLGEGDPAALQLARVLSGYACVPRRPCRRSRPGSSWSMATAKRGDREEHGRVGPGRSRRHARRQCSGAVCPGAAARRRADAAIVAAAGHSDAAGAADRSPDQAAAASVARNRRRTITLASRSSRSSATRC